MGPSDYEESAAAALFACGRTDERTDGGTDGYLWRALTPTPTSTANLSARPPNAARTAASSRQLISVAPAVAVAPAVGGSFHDRVALNKKECSDLILFELYQADL